MEDCTEGLLPNGVGIWWSLAASREYVEGENVDLVKILLAWKAAYGNSNNGCSEPASTTLPFTC